MYSAYVSGNLKLYVGVVEGEPQILQRGNGAKISIILRDFQGKRIQILFTNADRNAAKEKKLADRIIKAKVHDGMFLTVLAVCNDPNETFAIGIDFKYRGYWNFNQNGQTTTVLMGTACRPRCPKDGMFCVTVPVDECKDGKIVTEWIDATFFDMLSQGNSSLNASKAIRVLNGEEKPIVVITGSGLRENDYNGQQYRSMVAYRITKQPT